MSVAMLSSLKDSFYLPRVMMDSVSVTSVCRLAEQPAQHLFLGQLTLREGAAPVCIYVQWLPPLGNLPSTIHSFWRQCKNHPAFLQPLALAILPQPSMSESELDIGNMILISEYFHGIPLDAYVRIHRLAKEQVRLIASRLASVAVFLDRHRFSVHKIRLSDIMINDNMEIKLTNMHLFCHTIDFCSSKLFNLFHFGLLLEQLAVACCEPCPQLLAVLSICFQGVSNVHHPLEAVANMLAWPT